MEQAFRLFDQQDTGFVDLTVARQYLTTQGSRVMSDADCDALFSSLQADSQGRVPMQEFRAMECWKVPSSKQVMETYQQQSIGAISANSSSSKGAASSGAVPTTAPS